MCSAICLHDTLEWMLYVVCVLPSDNGAYDTKGYSYVWPKVEFQFVTSNFSLIGFSTCRAMFVAGIIGRGIEAEVDSVLPTQSLLGDHHVEQDTFTDSGRGCWNVFGLQTGCNSRVAVLYPRWCVST